MPPSDSKHNLRDAADRFAEAHAREWTPERRLHISPEPFSLDTFADRQQKTDMKPTGLWYGFNASWIDWCMSEMPHWLTPFVYEVVVDPARILTIPDAKTFEAFEDEYRETPEYEKFLREERILSTGWGGRRFITHMNYDRVAEKYDGMEITPYLYTKRLDSVWYYGWDCSSGCIWNRSGIKELRLVAVYNPETDEFDLQRRGHEV